MTALQHKSLASQLMAILFAFGLLMLSSACQIGGNILPSPSPTSQKTALPTSRLTPIPNSNPPTASPKTLPTLITEYQNNPSPETREALATYYLDSANRLLNSSKVEDLEQARDNLINAQVVTGPFPTGKLGEILRQVNSTLEIVNRNLVSAYVRSANDMTATKDRSKCKEALTLLKKALDIAPQNTDVQNATLLAEQCMEPILIAHGSRDFGSKQGGNNWQYLIRSAGKIQSLTWDGIGERGAWSYIPGWIRLDQTGGHPPFEPDAVIRRWISNINAQVQVRITAHKIDCGGDGVRISFEFNEKLQWSSRISSCDRNDAIWVSPTFSIKIGDTLDFGLYANGNTVSDYTYYDPKIFRID